MFFSTFVYLYHISIFSSIKRINSHIYLKKLAIFISNEQNFSLELKNWVEEKKIWPIMI